MSLITSWGEVYINAAEEKWTELHSTFLCLIKLQQPTTVPQATSSLDDVWNIIATAPWVVHPLHCQAPWQDLDVQPLLLCDGLYKMVNIGWLMSYEFTLYIKASCNLCSVIAGHIILCNYFSISTSGNSVFIVGFTKKMESPALWRLHWSFVL